MKIPTFERSIIAVAIASFAYALLQTVRLAMIAPILLLTTPLSMIPLCGFGALFAVWNVKQYPAYSGMGVLLAVLTAAMI